MSREGEVLGLWRSGKLDTAAIASKVGIREAEVYRIVAQKARPDAKKLEAAGLHVPLRPAKKVLRPARPTAREPRRQYRLYQGNAYLHKNGVEITMNTDEAWTGNAEEALACCASNPMAHHMQMELVI